MNWNELTQEIHSLEEIQSSEKERILSGWNVLEDCLGTGWFDDEAASSNHPWIQEFKNKAPWVKAGFGIFGERISMLSDVEGVGCVIEKLKKSDQVISAQAEINAAWKLKSAGLDFEFFEYTHPPQEKKSVDLRVIIDSQTVSVEVTVPRVGHNYSIQMNNCSRLSRALTHPDVCAGMIIFNSLSNLWTENLESRIEDSIKKAIERQRMVEFRDYHFAEFCIAPKKLKFQVDEWKKRREMEPNTNLRSDYLDMNWGRRLHRIVQDKCKQFETESPGIVYMEGIPFSTWFGNRPQPWNFTQADIQMASTENSDLLFVAIGGLGYGSGLSVHNVDYQGRNYVSNCHILLELYEENWVLTNPFHKWTNLNTTEIINAFWRTCDSISSRERMRMMVKSIEDEFDKDRE